MEEAVKSVIVTLGAIMFVAAISMLLHYIAIYEETYEKFLATLGNENVIVEMGDIDE